MKPRFWSAFTLSAFGYETAFFAMTLFIFNRGRNPLDVGLFTALTLLPKLVAPLFGMVSARIGGRKSMSAACGMAGILIACVGFPRTAAPLFVLWFLISCLFVFISNVRTTLMVDLMGHRDNRKGNAAVLLALNATRIVVPALGGIASLWLPAWLFFCCIGIVYLAAMCLAWGPDVKHGRSEKKESIDLIGPFVRGIRGLVDHPELRFLAGVAILWQLFLGVKTTLFVVYVKSLLELGDVEYGYFMAAIGIGSIAGSMLGPRLRESWRQKPVLIFGLCAHFLSFAALGLIRSLWGAVALMGGSFAVFYAALVSLHSMRDRSTPSDIRGMVYGAMTAAGTPPAVISMLAGSFMIRTMGIGGVSAACGICAAVALVLLSIFDKRSANREAALARRQSPA